MPRDRPFFIVFSILCAALALAAFMATILTINGAVQ